MQREKHIITARNAHSAKVAGVPSGATGAVDANNPGVEIALKAGLLQPVREDGLVLPSSDEGTVPASELRAAVAEIDRRGRLLEHQRRELADLHAQVEALTAPKAPVVEGDAAMAEPAPSRRKAS